jgi:hypothetical protein
MGNRRRKMVKKKFSNLSWNKYNKMRQDTTPNLSEQKITKVIENNSVMIEKMKLMSSSLDRALQTIDDTMEAITSHEEITNEEIDYIENELVAMLKPDIEPPIIKATPPTTTTTATTDLKKMYKKDLIKLAKEKGCTVRGSMSKNQLIRAIESAT